MNDPRFDALARRLDPVPTRRGLLRGALALGTNLGLVTGFEDAGARKRKKNKKKPPPQESLCAKACSAGCSACYQRPSGTLICGGLGSANCAAPCSTDTDCAGTGRPICTHSFSDRATGETSTWGCAGNPDGVCTSFTHCAV